MRTEEKIGKVLDCVSEIAGSEELPVRTSFELVMSLQRFFTKLETKDDPANT